MPKIVAQRIDWIELGYKLFSVQGISGIVIEKMAAKLGCNKSSFYWHFKTKKDFVDELIRFWIAKETEEIIQEVEKADTPQERLDSFLTIAFVNAPYLEFIFFLKRYAKNNEEVQEVIDQVDRRRLEFSARLFQDLGYSRQDALVKAGIFYKYLIGYHELIRNKEQDDNYLVQVKEELKHFLKL